MGFVRLARGGDAAVALGRVTPARLQERASRRRHPHQHASARHHFADEKASILGLLPDRQAGTGCAPGVHHLGVGTRLIDQPLDQVEHQGIEAMVVTVPAHQADLRAEKACTDGAARWLNLSNAFIKSIMMQKGYIRWTCTSCAPSSPL